MKITCSNCKATIKSENVDLVQKIAKCDLCDNIFSCAEQLGSLGGVTEAQTIYQKPEVPLPEKMKMAQLEDGFQLAYKWFSPTFVFLTIFCAIWDGFMAMWFTIAITTGTYEMAAFGSLHALVGIALTYYTIAGYVNWTAINVRRDQIDIVIGPLPAPGKKSIPASDIDQIYCKKVVSHSRNGGTTVTYEVRLLDKNGKDIKLIGGVSQRERVFFIEQEIERFYRIIDRKVEGEIVR